MTKQLKKLVYLLLGLIAGTLVWFTTELQMSAEGGSFYLRLLAQGGGIGALFGAILGTGEGLALSIPRKSGVGAAIGILLGFLGGIVAIVAAQSVLLYLSGGGSASIHDITTTYLPAARILGWTLMGAVIGSIEGARSRSFRRTVFGIIGGAAGGLLGGAVYELSGSGRVSPSLQRLFGFLGLGILMGAGLSFADSSGRYGIIKVMNGKFKGKEFILSKRNSLLGSAFRCDIILPGDKLIAPLHARIRRRDKSLYLEKEAVSHPVWVNDERRDSVRLKYNDVVRCGHTVLRYIP